MSVLAEYLFARIGLPFGPVEVHDILSNERRQHVIKILDERDERMTIGRLADMIAVAETGQSPPPENVRQSVYVALRQTHLPKLDDMGIADFDSHHSVVELTDESEDFRVYLETVSKYGLAWSEVILGVSFLGLLLIIAADIGVPILAEIGSLRLALLTFLAMMILALYWLLKQRTSPH